jgi:hypothetical protein
MYQLSTFGVPAAWCTKTQLWMWWSMLIVLACCPKLLMDEDEQGWLCGCVDYEFRRNLSNTIPRSPVIGVTDTTKCLRLFAIHFCIPHRRHLGLPSLVPPLERCLCSTKDQWNRIIIV